jgi:Cdc6-like AAA superfamily ATPase
MPNILIQENLKPLYPDLIWAKPENRNNAGKILLIGGNEYDFKNIASIYEYLLTAKVGSIKIIFPDILKKEIKVDSDVGIFLPSNRSGSFSQKALAELMDYSSWPDSIILGGDFGKNAETRLLFERFLDKTKQPKIVFVNDSAPFIPQTISNNLNIIIQPLPIIQKFFLSITHQTTLNLQDNPNQIYQKLIELNKIYNQPLVSLLDDNIIFIYNQKIVITKLSNPVDPLQIFNKLSAFICFYISIYENSIFEAIISGIYNSI